MTREQLNELLAKPSIAARNLDLLKVQRAAPSAKLEHFVGKESVEATRGAGSDSGRYRVRITSRRKRLLDPDNLVGKYFVDSCRYAGLIPNDSATEIEYSITQVKVGKGEKEETIIEIERIPR